MKVTLREYPYPYKAAFSFCNDIDTTTVKRYEFIRQLFQEYPSSRVGSPEGIPYSESFFVFNHNPYHANQVSLSTHRDLLLPDLESGYLSILHSWGDYNFNPVFRREHAARAMELLSGLRHKCRVWVNHGTLHNLQNLSPGMGYGDVSVYKDGAGLSYAMQEYHLDLTRELGIRYYWTGRLTRLSGQRKKVTAASYWRAYYGEENSDPAMSGLIRALKRHVYVPLKIKAGKIDNSILRPLGLRDGSLVFDFPRFGRYDLATADDMHRVLTSQVIEDLVRQGGSMVFFTHLGKSRCGETGMAEGSRETLSILKALFDSGDLWIAPVADMLDYHRLSESIRFELKPGEIAIREFRNPVEGAFQPRVEELAGLTFCCDERPETVTVSYNGACLETRCNPADSRGRRSLTLQGRSGGD